MASRNWSDIFDKISPITAADEQLIIDTLVTEIQSKFAISLSPTVTYDRMVSDAPAGSCAETVVLVGASHSRNLVPHFISLGFNVQNVDIPSWKPNSMTVSTGLAELEQILKTTSNVAAVIFTCLDGAAFYAMTDDSIIPISRDSGGNYHVYGQLVGAPADMFAASIKVCLPFFNCFPAVKKIILSPLPRYWQERCCDDEDHVSNMGDPLFETSIFNSIDEQRRQIKDVLHTSGCRNCSTLNFGQLCTTEPGAKVTNDDIKNALAVMWGSDPVHPSEDAYATAAVNLCSYLQPAGSNELSSQSPALDRPLKRPRWLQEDSSNTVVPRGGFSRGRGPWRGRGGPRGRMRGGGRRGRY
jgi:hypothetical protein